MSVHIEAKRGEIAETVLLPGDPMRAKWIAETFLEKSICYNTIRGMFGFTGYYKDKKISVQGTGMEIPSTLIYCSELITQYDVKNLIRVGSAGSYQKNVNIRDIVIAMTACKSSGLNKTHFNDADYAPIAKFDIFQKAVQEAIRRNVLNSDECYAYKFENYKNWADYGVLCIEMETAGIYTVAAKHNVKALSILTISDSLVTKEKTTADEREQTFKEMIEIALEVA